MNCKHEWVKGIALCNYLTNGTTLLKRFFKRGEGMFSSRQAELITVHKCKHCGKSIALVY